jgi:hypothetical protein
MCGQFLCVECKYPHPSLCIDRLEKGIRFKLVRCSYRSYRIILYFRRTFKSNVAELHHFYTLALGKFFHVAQGAALSLLYSKIKFLKQTKVKV